MNENYVLELRHIRKEYPGVVALKDVSLSVKAGEILGLVGENGAGKSTLIKTCSGAVIPTSGSIVINGQEHSSMTPRLAAENGIAIIYQEFNNVKGMSVAENLFLGNPIRKGMLIDRKAMVEKSREIFRQLNIEIDPNIMLGKLSVGFQQMVEIGKAIKEDAKVLIMDEPSAPLTNAEVESMFKVCDLLKSRGVSIIYISHRMEEIFRLTDRVVILRDGEYVGTRQTNETNIDDLIELMVGRKLTESYPSRPDRVDRDRCVLELDGVSGNGTQDIRFKVHRSEVLGLGGLIGAGRTELAQVIFGYAAKESGRILLNGREINPRSPRQAIDLGIAYVPEDRKNLGALLHNSIRSNVNMATYKKISRFSVINGKKENETAKLYRDKLRIKTPTLSQLVKNLSGGNQQKVILAKWLAANTELIILDEPTRGIDVGAKFEIYTLINDLIAQGKTVLLISSEMEELMGMSDRIVILCEGKVTGELRKADFNQNAIMRLASRSRQQSESGTVTVRDAREGNT